MLLVGICDDEKTMLAKMAAYVQDCCRQEHIFVSVQSFEKGEALLYEIEDGTRFDLLLLDIEMPRMNGMELAARAKGLLPDLLIIFFTSHMEYVLDAYELSVFRYIPKSDYRERLFHALSDAAKLIELQRQEAYIIQNQNRLERIPLKNLLYITHEGKNALLVTEQREGQTGEHICHKVRKTLQQVLEELGTEEFMFVDRSYIVNLSKIMSVGEGQCILRDGTRLPVSQNRMANLKESLLRFWKMHM